MLAFSLAALAPFLLPAVATAQKPKRHEHRVIEIQGQPILTMLQLKLQRPRRVVRDARGNLFIADAALGKVFRIDTKGKSTVFADGLNEPTGLSLDGSGKLFVANYADGKKGAGSIVRYDSAGKPAVVAEGLTGPKALAVAADGRLFAALSVENRIVVVRNGKAVDFARRVNAPSALCFDAAGNLLVAGSNDGVLTKITPAGKAVKLCGGLQAPSDVAVGPYGEIVVANFSGTQISQVRPNGRLSNYFSVPRETIGLCFEPDGNLVVLNWEKGFAVKARIRMSVPCPHCDQSIPLRIRPFDPAPPDDDSAL